MLSFKERLELIKVANGEEKADLVLRNGKMVNVNTGEIVEDMEVAVKGRRVAVVGDASNCIGEETKIMDCRSFYLVPGLLDAHIHIESSMLTLTNFAKVVLPRGTTGVFIDPHEIANVLGLRGIGLFAREAEKLPLKVFIEIPPCVPSAPGLETTGAEMGLKSILRGLKMGNAVGLAEVMDYPGVVRGDRAVLRKIEETLRRRLIVEGHAPLLTGRGLSAYVSSGVSSDHESTVEGEAVEKLRLGLKLEIREGSTCRDLARLIKPILRRKLDLRHCLLACDDKHPGDLIGEGHMDHVVRRAVEEGVDPVKAVQMATINVAEHFRVELEVGSISPGRYADIVLTKNLERFQADKVIANGMLVSSSGKLLLEFPRFKYPRYVYETMNMKPVSAGSFHVKSPKGRVRVRVIGLVERQAVTKHEVFEMEAPDGFLRSDVERDIVKIAVVERHKGTGRVGLGFVHGFGLKSGAIASSVAHDAHNVIVVGVNEEDMALAVNKLRKCGGGQIVVGRGSVLKLLRLPLAGLMSEEEAEEIAGETNELRREARKLGVKAEFPFMQLSFLSLPVIPFLKITDKGLFDVEKFKFVDLLVN